MLVVHRHRVRHLTKVIRINNWKCSQRPSEPASESLCESRCPAKRRIRQQRLPAPVAHFAGINCTKLIRGLIGCWLFRQALLALLVWLRVEVSAYHAQCCPRLNGFDSADNATPLAGAVPYPDGVFECVSRLNHHSRSVRASLIASRSSKTCQISSESSWHFA
jgi:hypothetical protein